MNGTLSFLYNYELAHTTFSTDTLFFLMNFDYVNAQGFFCC